MKTVVIALSGGVDSAVSAYLLKKQGYNVIGMFMKNWEEKDEKGHCKSSYEFQDVCQICEHLTIPYYSVNFAKEYKEQVFKDFLKDCQNGLTPNPDILCNKEIKFQVLLQKALELGADFLATGHYCQKNNKNYLLKGKDPNKDQSYFLYTLKEKILEKVLFPIGHILKKDVRILAEEKSLHIHNKKDSTGICFIGKRNFKEFVKGYLGYTPGSLKKLNGEIIGQHDGLAYYTIGQRKGLKIGGQGDAWYVVKKDLTKNIVYIEQGKNHPALFHQELFCSDLSWVNRAPLAFSSISAKIRYRQQDQECVILKIEKNKAHVRFKEPQRAITPGQAIVFYQDKHCLGGGKIDKACKLSHL